MSLKNNLVRFNEVNFGLYIQIKGGDGKWTLVMFNAYSNVFMFFGFADEPYYLDNDVLPSRQDLENFVSHYKVLDRDSLKLATDKHSNSLTLDSFVICHGALMNYGLFIDDGEATIRTDSCDIVEKIKHYKKEKMSIDDDMYLTKVKLPTAVGVVTINVSTDTVSYGWDYDLILN